MWVAGADGCRRGWLRCSRDTVTGDLKFQVVETAPNLLELCPNPEILCIDIPIGLPERGGRECDRLARKHLGWPRRNSVFPPPVRPALATESREDAGRITESIDRRRVGTQAWALYPKVRAVDDLMRANQEARRRVREVHPEVCFWAWNGRQAIQESKKTPEGREKRSRLAEEWLGSGVLTGARTGLPRRDVADDDILDAIAALWTATRVASGTAQTLPDDPPVDSMGLRMEMVY